MRIKSTSSENLSELSRKVEVDPVLALLDCDPFFVRSAKKGSVEYFPEQFSTPLLVLPK